MNPDPPAGAWRIRSQGRYRMAIRNPVSRRRDFLAAVSGVSLSAAMPAWSRAADKTEEFVPQLGRTGKDVMWLPTPDELIGRMMRLAGVGPDDEVVDLGSGDGKIVIAAARDFGARAWGVEFDAKLVAFSRRAAAEAGVADLATFVQGDIFTTDFSKATVVTMYLLPYLNLRLRHILLTMRPGTRIVTHQFHMGRWEPDETTLVANRPGHLWIIPANAGGIWKFDLPQSDASLPAELELTQTFQKLKGIATLPGIRTTLRMPRLTGNRLAFAFTDAEGQLRSVQAQIDANTMQGTISGPQGERPFSAHRDGVAPAIGGSEPASEEELAAAVASMESI